jgi:hypothetical protein
VSRWLHRFSCWPTSVPSACHCAATPQHDTTWCCLLVPPATCRPSSLLLNMGRCAQLAGNLERRRWWLMQRRRWTTLSQWVERRWVCWAACLLPIRVAEVGRLQDACCKGWSLGGTSARLGSARLGSCSAAGCWGRHQQPERSAGAVAGLRLALLKCCLTRTSVG